MFAVSLFPKFPIIFENEYEDLPFERFFLKWDLIDVVKKKEEGMERKKKGKEEEGEKKRRGIWKRKKKGKMLKIIYG